MSKTSIVLIIQARMGSTRLPNKMSFKLGEKTVIERILERVKKVKNVKKIIVAISKKKNDDFLANVVRSNKIAVYRGSENDLVDRFYQAAKKWKATHVVRVCADNPFISGSEIDRLVQFYFSSNWTSWVFRKLDRQASLDHNPIFIYKRRAHYSLQTSSEYKCILVSCNMGWGNRR